MKAGRNTQAFSCKRKLTARQELFAAHVSNPESPGFGNATRAAELAGYKGAPGSNQLAVQGCVNMKNPIIKRAVADAFDRAGCTPDLAAKALLEALSATQTRVFLGKSDTLLYSKPIPDNMARLAALRILLEAFEVFGVEVDPFEKPALQLLQEQTSKDATKWASELCSTDETVSRRATEEMCNTIRQIRESRSALPVDFKNPELNVSADHEPLKKCAAKIFDDLCSPDETLSRGAVDKVFSMIRQVQEGRPSLSVEEFKKMTKT